MLGYAGDEVEYGLFEPRDKMARLKECVVGPPSRRCSSVMALTGVGTTPEKYQSQLERALGLHIGLDHAI